MHKDYVPNKITSKCMKEKFTESKGFSLVYFTIMVGDFSTAFSTVKRKLNKIIIKTERI